MSDNQKIVQQWFDHIAAGDAAAAFALFADNIVYELKGSTPVSGIYRGIEQIVNDFFTPWRRQIDGALVVTVDEMIAAGERVVVLGRGVATTVYGLPYNNDYAFVFTVRNGRISQVSEYLDTALVETAAYGKRLVEP